MGNNKDFKPDELHPSDSSEQRSAEKEILTALNKLCNLSLSGKKLIINNTSFQLDGYSEEPPVLCEIYSRIGKLKPAHKNKINKDILKMLLIEKLKGNEFRKIIAFADEETARSFTGGESWYAKLKDNFNIEFVVVEVTAGVKTKLIEAQKRQYR